MDANDYITNKKCPQCGDFMIDHPFYDKLYCNSWTYMEGGCPPAPMFLQESRTNELMLKKYGRK